jgi:hypothetical protein
MSISNNETKKMIEDEQKNLFEKVLGEDGNFGL